MSPHGPKIFISFVKTTFILSIAALHFKGDMADTFLIFILFYGFSEMKMVMVGKILLSTNLTKIYFDCSLTSELIILVVSFLACFFGANDHPQIVDLWIPNWIDQFTSIFLQNARKQLLQPIFRLGMIGNHCRGNGISGVHTYQCSIQAKKSKSVEFNVFFIVKSHDFWSIFLRLLLTIPPPLQAGSKVIIIIIKAYFLYATSTFYRFQWFFLCPLHIN